MIRNLLLVHQTIPVPAEAGTFGRLTGSSSSALPGSIRLARASEIHSKCSVAACGVVLTLAPSNEASKIF